MRVGSIKTWLGFIEMLDKAGKLSGLSDDAIGSLLNTMVSLTEGGKTNGDAIRTIYQAAMRQNNAKAETAEQRKKRLKEQTKEAKSVGAQRSVGLFPRVSNTVLDTVGDIAQTAGDVVAANAALPSVALTAMGQAMPRTAGDDIMGVPNMGGVMSALGAAYGAAPAAVAHGLGSATNKMFTGVGNDILQTAADRQMQANLYQNTQDMMNMNVTPSQARIFERTASANNTARRQASAGGTY